MTDFHSTGKKPPKHSPTLTMGEDVNMGGDERVPIFSIRRKVKSILKQIDTASADNETTLESKDSLHENITCTPHRPAHCMRLTKLDSQSTDHSDHAKHPDPESQIKIRNIQNSYQISGGIHEELVIQTEGGVLSLKRRPKLAKKELKKSFSPQKRANKKWGDIETRLFYRALRVWGTDFGLISTLFHPYRSKKQIKAKYKKEERLDPGIVD